jgi:hypothetical protein
MLKLKKMDQPKWIVDALKAACKGDPLPSPVNQGRTVDLKGERGRTRSTGR